MSRPAGPRRAPVLVVAVAAATAVRARAAAAGVARGSGRAGERGAPSKAAPEPARAVPEPWHKRSAMA